ncbi:MAG: PAS domain S-box protein [Deltaproteobacteria bacterium]|nr:PAS domain S-box protein [Deltaproteobacteria bacterium]
MAGIMIVEDEGLTALYIRKCLENKGYSVTAVLSSGKDAIIRAEEVEPQLILMDINLEGMIDGIDTARRIRLKSDIPIIFLTAYADDETLNRAKAVGAYGYLLKPFEDIQLYTALEIALSKYEMETMLRSSEEKFRSLIENSSDCIYQLDLSGNVEYMNPTGLKLNSINNKSRLTLMDLIDLASPDCKDALQSAFSEAKKGETSAFEYDSRDENGHKKWWAAKLGPIRDNKEKVSSLIMISSDITKRKKAEEELQKSRAWNESIINTAVSGIVTIDDKGTILSFNPAAEKMFGYEEGEVIGSNVSILMPEPFKSEHNTYLENYLNSGEKKIIGIGREAPAVRKDGSTLSAFITVSEMYIGKTRMFTGIINDITALKEAEKALRQSKERHSKAQKIAHLGHWEWDITTNKLLWSEETYRIFGMDKNEFGASYEAFLERVHPDDRKSVLDAVDEALAGKRPYCIDHRILLKDGAVKIVQEQAELSRDNKGKPLCMMGTVQDLTEFKIYQDRSILAAEVFDNAIEGLLVTDEKGNIELVNKAFTSITGYRAEEAIGKNPNMLRSDRHDKEFFKNMWHTLLKDGYWHGEIWNRRKSGEAYPEQLTISAIKDGDGKIKKFVSIFHDLTDLKRSEEQIKYKNNYDGLTGLPNMVLFKDRLNQALNRASDEGNMVCLLFVGLDRFKNINESLGYPAGDKLLQGVAARLESILWETDTVTRFAGDEFAIILEAFSNQNDAVRVANRVLNSFSEPFKIDELDLHASASIGITLYPDDGNELDTLMINANAAMRRAKEAGGASSRLYAEEMNLSALKFLSVENEIRRGLDRDEFIVYYQPKISMFDGTIVGLEALARWQQTSGGFIEPGDFIPIAEETGLIVPLGETILRKSCEQAKKWRDAGFNTLNIAVNLSGRQFLFNDIVETVISILEETGLPPSMLGLEITESILMNDVDEMMKKIKKLSSLGIQLYIDDFGTGYSSLSYLKKFKIDALKIDQSFVRDITTNENDASITKAVISLSHSLGLKVVAEGVETGKHLDFLLKHNCDEMQGYYFSRPLPGKKITEMLKSGKKLDLGVCRT